MDEKEPRHGPSETILDAMSVPGQFLLGCARADPKTNKIPMARELFGTTDQSGSTVSMDALHTFERAAWELVVEHGAHCLLTVKRNRPTFKQNIDTAEPAPTADSAPPCRGKSHRSPDDREEPGQA